MIGVFSNKLQKWNYFFKETLTNLRQDTVENLKIFVLELARLGTKMHL
jgi:hypothetical protein